MLIFLFESIRLEIGAAVMAEERDGTNGKGKRKINEWPSFLAHFTLLVY